MSSQAVSTPHTYSGVTFTQVVQIPAGAFPASSGIDDIGDTIEVIRKRMEYKEYTGKASKEGLRIRDILEKVCPPKGYRLRAGTWGFKGLSYPTDIPGVTIEVNFESYLPGMSGVSGVISTFPNVYYKAAFTGIDIDSPHGKIPSPEDISDAHISIKTELKNCREILSIIKDNPICTCCGIPMREHCCYSLETYEKYMGMLGISMKSFLAGKTENKPKKTESMVEYENHPEFHSCGDIYGWRCDNCNREFWPWENTNVPPEYNTQHPHFRCYCGSSLRYTLNHGGELVMRCGGCRKYIVEEEAIAIALSKA